MGALRPSENDKVYLQLFVVFGASTSYSVDGKIMGFRILMILVEFHLKMYSRAECWGALPSKIRRWCGLPGCLDTFYISKG